MITERVFKQIFIENHMLKLLLQMYKNNFEKYK